MYMCEERCECVHVYAFMYTHVLNKSVCVVGGRGRSQLVAPSHTPLPVSHAHYTYSLYLSFLLTFPLSLAAVKNCFQNNHFKFSLPVSPPPPRGWWKGRKKVGEDRKCNKRKTKENQRWEDWKGHTHTHNLQKAIYQEPTI